ncbi:DUF6602 domain-containing protein [Nannocystis pusilla]|uniref:DUF6602 domain-containing protein n=1 Tax=Nannocystis pusilla TaxID=889268 RepID=UPI003BF226D5
MQEKTLKTLADVLHQLIESRRDELRAFDYVKHPTVIGDAYEGLTKSLLERSIPDGMDISVKKGFIRNTKGDLSNQVDCMIVEGEGTRIPETDHWVYPTQQIIMYIEVKKRLHKEDLKDGIEKMSRFFRVIMEPRSRPSHLVVDAWIGITGLPFRLRTDSATTEAMVYHSLMTDAFMPACVILGYDGYANEASLREAVREIFSVRDDNGLPIVGPGSWPSLIVARQASIVKMNGMPYALQTERFDQYHILASSPSNPLLILLELLWCRLIYYHGASKDIMGDGLKGEHLDPLMSLRWVDGGWRGIFHEQGSFEIRGFDWEPHEIDMCEFLVLTALSNGEVVKADDEELTKCLGDQNETLASLALKLQQKRLAYLDGASFVLLTRRLQIGFFGDKWLAADDFDNRFSAWAHRWSTQNAEEST